jgi:RIO kinase 1
VCIAVPPTRAPAQRCWRRKSIAPSSFATSATTRCTVKGRPAVTATVRHELHKRGLKLGKLKPGALSKKTAFGAQLQHISWLSYEYETLKLLHSDGAAVPQPFASGENAILMSYYGDERRAAPTLNEVSLGPNDARRLFQVTLENIELMLRHGVIHGDLSAYNILFWEGQITLIDFPQVTDCHSNSRARAILQRDITRVCEYFARQGVASDPQRIMQEFWQRHVDGEIDA